MMGLEDTLVDAISRLLSHAVKQSRDGSSYWPSLAEIPSAPANVRVLGEQYAREILASVPRGAMRKPPVWAIEGTEIIPTSERARRVAGNGSVYVRRVAPDFILIRIVDPDTRVERGEYLCFDNGWSEDDFRLRSLRKSVWARLVEDEGT